MKFISRAVRRAFVACLASSAVLAWSAESFDTSAANLIAVLRESPGTNLESEALRPMGSIRVQLADGRQAEIEASWFEYLGDMHVRLVFEGGQKLQSASPDDLQRLALTPADAMTVAVKNLRSRHGEPVVAPWSGGLMRVEGKSFDFNSSYFLDRDFWLDQLKLYPDGLVVSVPERGGLLFAPASDEAAVAGLRFSAAALFAADARTRVSSALYLFRDGRWSVFQPPQRP